MGSNKTTARLACSGLLLMLCSCGGDEPLSVTTGSDARDDGSSSRVSSPPASPQDDSERDDQSSPMDADYSSEYSVDCDGFGEKLRDCGLLGPGPFACAEADTEIEQCFIRCELLASCNILDEALCGGSLPLPLERCFVQCDSVECDSGELIPSDYVCDGEADCSGGSDERDCPVFVCEGDGQELPDFYECDGEVDCDDGSDEHPGCLDLLFACDDGELFPPDFECDGERDCADGSDEHADCADVLFECEFSGESVPLDFECDGEEDCLDGTDEHDGCGQLMCSD